MVAASRSKRGLPAERRQSRLAFVIVRSGRLPAGYGGRGQRLAASPQRTQVDGGSLNRTGVRAKATAKSVEMKEQRAGTAELMGQVQGYRPKVQSGALPAAKPIAPHSYAE